MDKKQTQMLAVFAVLVIAALYIGLGNTQSIVAVSDIKTDAGNNYMLITKTVSSNDVLTLTKGTQFTDSKGATEQVGSEIKIKTTPVSIMYIAPIGGNVLPSQPNGEIGFCQSQGGCLLGQRYGSTALKPVYFNAGYIAFTYRVDIYKNGALAETRNITYTAPRGQTLGNVQDISFQSGKVTLTNIGITGQRIASPELSDVAAWQDLNNPSAQYFPTAKSLLTTNAQTQFFTSNSRLYECSTGFTLDATLYTQQCLAQIRQQLEKIYPFDYAQPAGYYGNFDANTGFKYDTQNGYWKLQDGAFDMLVTFTIDKTFADTLVVSSGSANPAILGAPTVDSNIGPNSYSKICFNVKNNGQDGPVVVSATSTPNPVTFPPVVTFVAGETKQICGFGYGTNLGSDSVTLQLCGSNQFGTTNCVQGNANYNVVQGGPTPNPNPALSPSPTLCSVLGADWSLNPKTGGCEKAANYNGLYLIGGILALLGIAYIAIGGRKK